MALTLLRHTTPLVTPGTCYGATDLALAESFAQEAEAVLDRLPAASCVISSPLTRCRRLAEHVSAAEGLELRIAEPWKEMDFGGHPARRPGRSEAFDAALLPGFHEVSEPGEPALEAQLDRADGTVALLADDDLGLAVQRSISSCQPAIFVEVVIAEGFSRSL